MVACLISLGADVNFESYDSISFRFL